MRRCNANWSWRGAFDFSHGIGGELAMRFSIDWFAPFYGRASGRRSAPPFLGRRVMFRNWLDGSRDMYLSISHDGITFSKPARLGSGTWKLNACPMDGGGLVMAQGRIVSVWRRDREIFIANPGEQERKIGEGIDVAVSAGAKGAFAAWATPDGIRALMPGRGSAITVSQKGSFPAIAGLSDGRAAVAWEDDGKIVAQVLR